MKSVRNKDSKAEKALRSELHRCGLRYRVHVREVIGNPDICVKSRKIAIFVDGDLWHGNPSLPSARGKKSFADLFPNRTQWWLDKIERNMQRDRFVCDQLKRSGWLVIRVWESQIADDSKSAAKEVLAEIKRAGR